MTLRCMQKKGIRINAKQLLIYVIKEKASAYKYVGFLFTQGGPKSQTRGGMEEGH